MIGRLTDEQFKAMWYARVSTERIAAQANASREGIDAHAATLRLPRRTVGSCCPLLTQEARIEADVEYLLHEVMQRRNSTATTRERLQAEIEKIVVREIKAFCAPKKRVSA